MIKKLALALYEFLTAMTAAGELELHGNFQTFLPAEILTEIRQARLDGSLRLSRGEQKIIVYFRGGKIIFAVSNSRSSRLFEILLREKRIEKKVLIECPNFADDRRFGDFLVQKLGFLPEEIDALFVFQIENIVREITLWDAGEWIFNPLVRLRENINYAVNPEHIFVECARRTPSESIIKKFSSVEEKFSAVPFADQPKIQISPPEAFLFSRFADSTLTVQEIKQIGVLPGNDTLQTIYVLWLGGLLVRHSWNAAFSPKKIEAIRAAKISLVKEPSNPPVAAAKSAPLIETEVQTPLETEPPVEELTLETYLERVEKAGNYYELLNVGAKIPLAEIKTSYFALAKRFHPDHFYKDTDPNVLRRIQESFTRIAQAYETLKNQETREAYDFKIRKELAEKEKIRETSAEQVLNEQQNDQAAEAFERGFELLMNENYQEAVPMLARAVHYAPEIAKYHAYYGKALSVAEKYRHKAETELQTAVKLDANNPSFRLLLAEFFVQYNLLKRAEGELNRLLTMFPDNQEARQLLDSLNNK